MPGKKRPASAATGGGPDENCQCANPTDSEAGRQPAFNLFRGRPGQAVRPARLALLDVPRQRDTGATNEVSWRSTVARTGAWKR